MSNIHTSIGLIRDGVNKIQFLRDQSLGDVTWVSEQEILSKVRPLFVEHRVEIFPEMDILNIGGSNYLKLSVQLVAEDGSQRTVSSIHKEWVEAPFGATVTLAEKYLYKTLFQIEVGDDVSSNVERYASKARSESIKELRSSIKEVPKTQLEPMEESKATAHTIAVPTVSYESTSTSDIDNVDELVKQVAEYNKLEIKPDKPAKEEPVNAVADDTVSQEYRDVKNNGWDVKLTSAKDDQTAIKELNELYSGLKDKLQVHSDYTNIGMDFKKLFSEMGIKATNAQIRKYIIEMRIFGKDAMLELMSSESGKTKDEVLTIINPEPPKKKTSSEDFNKKVENPKAHDAITDQPKELVVKDTKVPEGIVMNRDGWVEFEDITPGQKRPPNTVIKYLQSLRAIGVNDTHISWMLSEDPEGLGLIYPHDNGPKSVFQLISTGTKGQLEYMLEFILKNHP